MIMQIRHFLFVLFISFLVMTACSASARTYRYARPPESAKASKRLDEIRLYFDEIIRGVSDFNEISNEAEKNFVLGYASYRKEKWNEADEFFRKSAPALTLIGDYVLFYRAAIANNLKRHEEAAQFLQVLADQYPDTVWKSEADYELARALIGLGHYKEAGRRIADYKKTARGSGLYEADILNARLLVKSGQGQAAIDFVKNLALHAGGEDELSELTPLFDEINRRFKFDMNAWLEKPLQQYALARSFSEQSQWDETARRIEPLLARDGLDFDTRVKSKWLLARSYRWTHRYDEAIAVMNELREVPRIDTYAPALQSMLATVYAKKDDYERAIEIREGLLKRYSQRSGIAANILTKIALLRMDEGKYEEALNIWQRVMAAHCGGRQCIMAKWYLGWCYYMMGRYDDAIRIFDGLLGREAKRAKINDRVLYWKGRILLKQGLKSGADTIFREVIKKYPHGYYAELAGRRIKGQNRGAADFAQVQWNGKSVGEWMPAYDENYTSSIHMRRAILFDRIGFYEEVGRELRAVDLKRYSELADSVMWYASKNYAHNLSLRIARSRSRNILNLDPFSDPFSRFLWEQVFPEAYRPTVDRAVEKNGVDPVLVWSIMKNESEFRSGVVSPAGAVGLMQLMPTTANRMMTEASGRRIDRRELYRPAVNITLGTLYLKKLGEMFPDNIVAVVASYNAGEEAVARWLKNGTINDIEEWVEEIPYSETNLYVKKVLASYWNYKRLYNE